MENEIIRRHQLGLSISGPFSRNRPRRRARRITREALVNLTPYAISTVVAVAFVAFLVCVFI